MVGVMPTVGITHIICAACCEQDAPLRYRERKHVEEKERHKRSLRLALVVARTAEGRFVGVPGGWPAGLLVSTYVTARTSS